MVYPASVGLGPRLNSARSRSRSRNPVYRAGGIAAPPYGAAAAAAARHDFETVNRPPPLAARGAAFASSVVASMPTVVPPTRPASASRCSTHVKTASCVSRSIRRRVRDTVEWSGGASASATVEELPEAQRIASPPRNRAFRIQAFEVAQKQHPEVAARRQTWPADPVRVELRTLRLDQGVEARLVEDTVQPLVERVARASRQIRAGHPHRPLPRTGAAFAHRHRN